MDFVKHERLWLKDQGELDEKWVQARIAEDPSLLGLGALVLRDKERIQPRAGRLDLLLQDPETYRRYEVEIQLGATDERPHSSLDNKTPAEFAAGLTGLTQSAVQ